MTILVYLGISRCILVHLGLSRTILDYLGLSQTISDNLDNTLDYVGLCGTIWDYPGQSASIWDYLELSLTISNYLGLSPEAIARPYNFETFCVIYRHRQTHVRVIEELALLKSSLEKTSDLYHTEFVSFFVLFFSTLTRGWGIPLYFNPPVAS